MLFDTWDKSQSSGISLAWKPFVDRVRDSGRFVALAGSLDVEKIRNLAPLEPEIWAVRGAACSARDRFGSVDHRHVSALATAVRDLSSYAVRAIQPINSEITCPLEPILIGLADAVGERRLGIDAELMIQGHEQVLGTNRPAPGTFAPGIGRTDDLPARTLPPATRTLMTLPQ